MSVFFLPTSTARSILLAFLATCILAGNKVTSAEKGWLKWNGHTYTLANSAVIIPCGALPLARRSASGEPTVAWFKDNQPLENTDKISAIGGNLTIAEFREQDVARYHCTAAVSKGIIRGDDVQLVLPVIPAITFTETSVVLAPGDVLRLVCPVQSWSPLPTSVEWYRSSEAIQRSDRMVVLPRGVLLVSNMTSDDVGEYSCSATAWGGQIVNSTGSVRVAFNESVLVPKDTYQLLETPPRQLTVQPASDVVLECLLQPVDGEYTVWQKLTMDDGGSGVTFKDVIPNDDVIIEPNMYIRWPKYSASDPAIYRCRVFNSSGDLLTSTSTTINVPSLPRAVSDDIEEKMVRQPQTASFACNVQSATNRTWYKDGVRLELCAYKKVLSDGTLEVNKVASYDAGIYQCIGSNAYGSASYVYHLNIDSTGEPSMPVITSAEFKDDDYVEIKWRQAKNSVPVFAYTFRFVEDKCDSRLKPISKVVPVTYEVDGKPVINCNDHPSTNETWCTYNFEVLDSRRDYLVYVTANWPTGVQTSKPKLAKATDNPTGTESPPRPMNLRVLDFGVVMLVQWDGVANAAGYRLDVRRQTNGADSVITADPRMDRSNDQTYAVIAAPKENTTMALTVTAIQEQITHQQLIEVNVIRPKLTDKAGARSNMVIESYDSPDGSKGVLAAWVPRKNVSYYYVWYRCDGREMLMTKSDTILIVKTVENRCTVVAAPMLKQELTNDTAGRALVQTYERWCKTLTTPEITSITPVEGVNSTFLYPMLVEWTSHKGSCEVNYQLRWKKASAELYLERDSLVVHKLTRAVVNGLQKDVTYDFQLMVFTNDSDLTTLSNISSYTIGPPHTAKDVQVNYQGFPLSPVELTWSPGLSGHNVNFYIIKLLKRGNDSQWVLFNLTTIPVLPGTVLKIDYNNLTTDTEYKVTINSINPQGSSGVTVFKFMIPSPYVPTAPVNRKATPVATTVPAGGSDVSLTEIEIGVIIGFCTSFVFVFVTALICILTRRRWKREDRQQCRSRSSRFESSASTYSCQQPLTIDMSHYEITPSVAGDLSDHSLANNNSEPRQLSQKDNSGQDSGISGTADDHRSSQDLEEYDDGEELLNSSISLTSRASTSRPASCTRWSGDQNGYAARLRNESECDSLLAESKRSTFGKHLTKAADVGHAADCSSLDDEDHCPLTINEAVL